jgi:hypothetical protein
VTTWPWSLGFWCRRLPADEASAGSYSNPASEMARSLELCPIMDVAVRYEAAGRLYTLYAMKWGSSLATSG